MVTKKICFTFARAGSKGVVGKNIKPLMGKPLLTYAIDEVKKLDGIAAHYVSTDGDDIARTARDNGADVIYRPNHLATDNANEWQAWQHAVTTLIESGEMFPDDVFISVPATSPLRTAADISKIITAFESIHGDLALGICKTNHSPYFNMVHRNSNGDVEIINQRSGVFRRQDSPNVYNITTVAYVTTARFLLENQSVMAGRTIGVEIEEEHAIDIDTQLDFDFAEFLMARRNSQRAV
ncbi:acylneuraminate cytidylyltransferase family protein [Pseudoalteromonas spongiae]|uniref:acylneuraminate cytidylyltransferase family protein n=1 Tax=Pseudoalteromonas spongiae TaxID=298657 RepID=UPI00373548B4